MNRKHAGSRVSGLRDARRRGVVVRRRVFIVGALAVCGLRLLLAGRVLPTLG